MGNNCSSCKTRQPSSTKKYKIGSILGSGSFGQVRSCVEKETKKQFAVKIVPKHLKKKRGKPLTVDSLSMLRNEVYLLSTLNHPSIVKIYDFFEDKSSLYAIMERCDGEEVFTRIVNQKRLEEKEACGLAKQMLQAIQYIHSQRIVHRDIKAENFLFRDSARDKIVLIDFGMSIKIDEDQTLRQICGSPHYVAPELLKKNYSFEIDMWALGIVVYLMLYGRYPFEGPDHRAIVHEILHKDPNLTNVENPPSDLAKHFVTSLLQRNPSLRLNCETAMNHPWIKKYAPVPC